MTSLLRRRDILTAAAIAGVAGAGAARAQSGLFSAAIEPPATVPDALMLPSVKFGGASASVPASAAGPRWRRYAVAAPADRDKPAICIVIDDLGVVHPATERVIAMPGPLTLSWFPFANKLPEQVAAGMARGHETTLHMPMQAFGNSTNWTGPDPLRVDLPEDINLARLRAAMEAVPNTVGLNNHMGSVATKDPALMALVARETNAQSMLFLDSVVIPHSQGIIQARQAGVPSASRDFFIDHSPDPVEIRNELAQIEAYARKHGDVIAIGHPWPHTVAALEEWLPTLRGKGFEFWPLSAMVARRTGVPLPA